MGLPKATRRKNGRQMMTISVEFHIDLDMLIMATAQLIDLGETVNVNRVYTKVKDLLQDKGYTAYYNEYDSSVLANAKAVASKLFPAMRNEL